MSTQLFFPVTVLFLISLSKGWSVTNQILLALHSLFSLPLSYSRTHCIALDYELPAGKNYDFFTIVSPGPITEPLFTHQELCFLHFVQFLGHFPPSFKILNGQNFLFSGRCDSDHQSELASYPHLKRDLGAF